MGEIGNFFSRIDKTHNYSAADQKIFQFFHASSTKSAIFPCSINEIRDFLVPNRQNLQILCSNKQNSRFFLTRSSEFALFISDFFSFPVDKIGDFSVPDRQIGNFCLPINKICNFFVPNRPD